VDEILNTFAGSHCRGAKEPHAAPEPRVGVWLGLNVRWCSKDLTLKETLNWTSSFPALSSWKTFMPVRGGVLPRPGHWRSSRATSDGSGSTSNTCSNGCTRLTSPNALNVNECSRSKRRRRRRSLLEQSSHSRNYSGIRDDFPKPNRRKCWDTDYRIPLRMLT